MLPFEADWTQSFTRHAVRAYLSLVLARLRFVYARADDLTTRARADEFEPATFARDLAAMRYTSWLPPDELNANGACAASHPAQTIEQLCGSSDALSSELLARMRRRAIELVELLSGAVAAGSSDDELSAKADTDIDIALISAGNFVEEVVHWSLGFTVEPVDVYRFLHCCAFADLA